MNRKKLRKTPRPFGRTMAILLTLFFTLTLASPILAENLVNEPVPQLMQEIEHKAAPAEAIEIASADGLFSALLQPEVLRPKGDLPLFSIQAQRFDQAFADKIIQELMAGAEIYPGREIEQRRLLKDFDSIIKGLEERYAAAGQDPNSSAYYQELQNLKTNGIPAFDPLAIQKLDEDGKLGLAGKKDDRFFYFGIDQQPENHYYRANFRNSTVEQIPYQIFASPIINLLEESNHSVELTKEEAAAHTRLDLSDVVHIYDSSQMDGPMTQAAFADAVTKIREQYAKQEEEYRDICEDAPGFGPEEAAEKAETFLQNLGLGNLALVKTQAAGFELILKDETEGLSPEEFQAIAQKGGDVRTQERTEPVWHLCYQPAFAGVAFAFDLAGYYDQPFYIDEEVTAQKTPADWQFSKIDLYLNDRGIVAFDYYAPMTVEKVSDEIPELLPEDEILGLAKELLPLKFSTQGIFSQGIGVNLMVRKMQLSYWRENDPNDPESGRVVPVWNFYGTYSRRYGSGMSGQEQTVNIDLDPGMEKSFLTLNAIDGTVIELARFRP